VWRTLACGAASGAESSSSRARLIGRSAEEVPAEDDPGGAGDGAGRGSVAAGLFVAERGSAAEAETAAEGGAAAEAA
jgi:hypothetical protein